jgi:hypothetical protein
MRPPWASSAEVSAERGQFQRPRQRAGLLFEQHAAAAHDPGAVLTQWDGLCAAAVSQAAAPDLRAAILAEMTEQAAWFRRRANQCAEFHQRGVVNARLCCGNSASGSPPEQIGAGLRVDGACKSKSRVSTRAMFPSIVATEDRRRSSPALRRCIGPTPGRRAAAPDRARKFPLFRHDLLRRAVQIPSARVVAEPLPDGENLRFLCTRKRGRNLESGCSQRS